MGLYNIRGPYDKKFDDPKRTGALTPWQDNPAMDALLPRSKPPRALTLVMPAADGQSIESQTIKVPQEATRPRRVAPGVAPGTQVLDEEPPAMSSPSKGLYNIQPRPETHAVSHAPAVGAPPILPSAPAPVDDRTGPQKRIDAANKRVDDLRNAPPKKAGKFEAFRKMFGGALQELGSRPARSMPEFYARLAGAGGQGLGGVLHRGELGKQQRLYDIKVAEKQRDEDIQAATAESMIDARSSNERYRDERLKQMGVNASRLTDKDRRKRISDDLKRLPYIDKDNPDHQRLLAEAKESGMIVDPESFGKGKQPRMRVLDKNKTTFHWYERQANGEWKRIRSEEDGDLVAGMTDARDEITGETYSSSRKFDANERQRAISNRLRERQVAAFEKSTDIRYTAEQRQQSILEAQNDMARMLDDEIEDAERALADPNTSDYDKEEGRKFIRDLKRRSAEAKGKGTAASPGVAPTAPRSGGAWGGSLGLKLP